RRARLACRARDVRCENNVREAEESLGDGGLIGKDVEAGGDAARDELLDERHLVDDRPARGVDERRAVLDQREALARDQTARLLREWHVERDDVRGGKELVECDAAAARVEGDLHAEDIGASGDLLADSPEANEPKACAREVAAEQLRARPVVLPTAIADPPVGRDDVPARREDQPDGEIGAPGVYDAGR